MINHRIYGEDFLVDFLRGIWEKVRSIKDEKSFFILFALLIVILSIFYRPFYYSKVLAQKEQQVNTSVKEANFQKREYASPIIDLNTASVEQLQTLPGIGPSKARAIVEYREKQPFSKPEDIMNVSGIGPKTFEKIKDRITVSTVNTVNMANNSPSTIQSTTQNNQSQNGNKNISPEKININTANLEELQKLPGIGPSKAQAIIDYREKVGEFKSIEEIKNVKGIGEKTYEKLKELITIY